MRKRRVTTERAGVRVLLKELEAQIGPPREADLARARAAWPRASGSRFRAAAV